MRRLFSVLLLLCCIVITAPAQTKRGDRMNAFHNSVNKTQTQNKATTQKQAVPSTRNMQRGDRMNAFHNMVNQNQNQRTTVQKNTAQKTTQKQSMTQVTTTRNTATAQQDDDYLDIKHARERLADLKKERKHMEKNLSKAIASRDKDPNATNCFAVESYEKLLVSINEEIIQHETFLRSKGKL